MQNNGDDPDPLDEAQLNELIQHLQSEEEASRASALESVESLQLWLTSHPALRQMVIVDSVDQIGPAVLSFLRAMLGLDSPSAASRASESD
jgi:hypothetical protein